MKKFVLSICAMMTIFCASAQAPTADDVTKLYNEAAAAYGKKDFVTAASSFEQVIDKGMDIEASAGAVATAKVYLPKCYFQLGGRAFMGGKYDESIMNFTKSAEYAELYDDLATMTQANSWIGKVYQKQGGDAFNAKDYATAAPIFALGYESDPRNTEMATWLAICYCETGEFQEGMSILYKIVKMGEMNPKYADAAVEAKKNIEIYTNNYIAKLQGENDYEGLIKMADEVLAKDPTNALVAKVRLQAYSDSKQYAKVYELAEATAAMQSSDEEKSNVYFILAAAHNAQEQKDQAIAAFKKVTAGPNAAAAAAAVAELTK